MMNDENVVHLVNNALDFLRRSVKELLSEKKENGQLKYAVIHFHAALELFIKARLCSEHWSLVFADMNKIDVHAFKSGKFKTVGFSDSLKRVQNLSRKGGMPERVVEQFRAIAEYRNQIIHFHSGQDSEKTRQKTIKSQLQAWYHLHALCNEWDFMENYKKSVSDINTQHKRLKKYLYVIYENRKGAIESRKREGYLFQKCPSCDFNAVNHGMKYDVLHSARCMVCGFGAEMSLLSKSLECGHEVAFYGEGFADCQKCGKKYESDDVMKILDSGYFPKGGIGPHSPCYCPQCGWASVVMGENDKWICAGCFTESRDDEVHQCDYCGDCYVGEYNELTWGYGCGMCEGRHGDDKS